MFSLKIIEESSLIKSLVGSQSVPYIFEDYVDTADVADALTKMYKMSEEEKKALSEKVLAYVDSEFNYSDMIDQWDETLNDLIENWQENYTRIAVEEIV